MSDTPYKITKCPTRWAKGATRQTQGRISNGLRPSLGTSERVLAPTVRAGDIASSATLGAVDPQHGTPEKTRKGKATPRNEMSEAEHSIRA